MKKLTALILAGAVCASTFAFTACNPNGDGGEEEGKIPQIPAGVNLSAVELEDMVKTYDDFSLKFRSSNNCVYNVYSSYSEESNWKEDENNYGGTHDSYDISQKFKYFKDGEKVFGDIKAENNSLRTSGYTLDGQEKENYLDALDLKYKGFIKDGQKAIFNEVVSSKTERNGEITEESYPEALCYFEEGFRQDENNSIYGIFSYDTYAGVRLGYFGEYVGDYVHYKNDENYSPYGPDPDAVDALEIDSIEYEFDMRADDTKLYMNVSRKLHFIYNGSQNSTRDFDTQITLYLDTAASNTEITFAHNYLNEENTKNTAYYAFDTEQAAKDIKDGKQVVISPSGGADTTGLDVINTGNGFNPDNNLHVLFYKNGEVDFDMFDLIRSVPVDVKDGVITIPADTYNVIKTAVGDKDLSEYKIQLYFTNEVYGDIYIYSSANIYL